MLKLKGLFTVLTAFAAALGSQPVLAAPVRQTAAAVTSQEEAETVYTISEMVDFENYTQLDDILTVLDPDRVGNQALCLNCGNETLLLCRYYPAPGSLEDTVSVRYDVTGDSAKTVTSGRLQYYSDSYSVDDIYYCLLEGVQPGSVTVSVVEEDTGYSSESFKLTVDSSLNMSGGREIKAGELIFHPQNYRQYDAMKAAFPEGYRIDEHRGIVYFISPEMAASDLVVNTTNRFEVKRQENVELYGTMFMPRYASVTDCKYVVSEIWSSEDIVEAGEAGHFHYFYPERRSYLVTRSVKGGITVKLIDEKNGYDHAKVDQLVSEMENEYTGEPQPCSRVSDVYDVNMTDSTYYAMVRYNLGVEGYFSYYDYMYDSEYYQDSSKYITRTKFYPDFAQTPEVSGYAEITDKFTGPSTVIGEMETTDIYNFYVISPTGDGNAEVCYDTSDTPVSDFLTIKDGQFLPYIDHIGDAYTAGDVNLDCNISIADLVCMQRFMVGDSLLTRSQRICADADMDGRIDGFDTVLLRKAVIEQMIPVEDYIN